MFNSLGISGSANHTAADYRSFNSFLDDVGRPKQSSADQSTFSHATTVSNFFEVNLLCFVLCFLSNLIAFYLPNVFSCTYLILSGGNIGKNISVRTKNLSNFAISRPFISFDYHGNDQIVTRLALIERT